MNTQRYYSMRDAYSTVYKTQVQVTEKKDDSYLEPDMKKRQENNEKARKDMDKVKGQKNPHFESNEIEISDEQFFNFMVENGITTNTESAEAIFEHMSDEWFETIYDAMKDQYITEKADDNGNTSCWDSHKKVGMKKKGGKMVNNCVPK